MRVEGKVREDLRNLFMRENGWNGAHRDAVAYRLADKVLATLRAAALVGADAEIAKGREEAGKAVLSMIFMPGVRAALDNLPDDDPLQPYTARVDELLAAEATLATRDAEIVKAVAAERERLQQPFAVLFLDGRNEHGTHVLPSIPTNLPIDYDTDIEDQAEHIMAEAERHGFKAGEDHIWSIWRYEPPQYGDEGRTEIEGYWEFASIDVEMSNWLNATARARDGQVEERG